MTYPETEQLQQLITNAEQILIIQADNPDADSLGSALALESILGELGKSTYLYCSVDMPMYLRYMPGWDRVSKDIPSNFDLSIIIDASTMTLLDAFQNPSVKGVVASKPCIILDHHEITDNPIPFATVTINDGSRASTGELIYIIGKELSWPMNIDALEFIASTILGDTQGLTNELAKAETYRVMAELIEQGVNRPKLEEIRREYGKMPEPIFRYKAKLIERTELYADGRLAIVTVPQNEINEYSPLYNPAPLIQNDILQTVGVQMAIVLKHYDSGRITAAIRANNGATVAGTLAEHFGGGGHQYASGFKLTDNRPLNEVKSECISKATELLDNLKQE
jgi:phosphoesterase RecJ-like protein